MGAPTVDHDNLVAAYTGGLAPPADLEPFAGSDRLRPDGRPRPDLRAELRRIPDLKNAGLVAIAVVYPVVVSWAAVTVDRPVGWVAAFLAMGAYFQRVLTLFHEAAHRLLFSRRPLNDLIGEQILGGTAALWAIGLHPANTPLYGGTLYMASPETLFVASTRGTPGVAGTGFLVLPFPLANNPALIGLSIITQFLAADPGNPHSVVLSPGLRWTILPILP